MTPGLLAIYLAAFASASQESPIEGGLRHYWNGDYDAAVAVLEGNCEGLGSTGARIECLSYLGFSQIALGREEPARRAFLELLSLDPAYRLDADLVSPKILTRFDDVSRQLAATWFDDAKASYARADYASAIRVLDRVLVLAEDHELAREYRKLCEERVALEAKLADATAAPVVSPVVEESPPEKPLVYHLDSEIERPVLMHRVDPEYPRSALLRGVEGSVVVSVVIDETGSIREYRVLRSVREDVDRAAVEALTQWRYRPATRSGIAVAVYGVIQLHFELSS